MPARSPALELIYDPAHLQQRRHRGWAGVQCIVVDQLRATTTMTTALHLGAREIIAVRTVEEAHALAALLPDALLAGERGGLPPAGFHLGNSPRDFTHDRVQGRSLILTTTNGTGALLGCVGSREIILACWRNLDAVRKILQPPCALIVAGTGADFALEDALVLSALLPVEYPLSSLITSIQEPIAAAMRRSRNGRRLVALGLAEDVDFSCATTAVTTVPRARCESLAGIPIARVTA